MAIKIPELLFDDSLSRLCARLRSLFVPSVSVVAILDLWDIKDANGAALQLYEWERDRLFTLAKGIGGVAVSVLATLIVNAIEGKATTDSFGIWLASALVALLLAWAAFILSGLRRLADEYPIALRLLNPQD